MTCATSGRGHLLLGDALGFVHVVDRALSVASFPAHDRAVTHVHQLRQRNILLTAGYDGGGSATAAGAGDTVNANSNVASATASMEAHATSSGVFPVVKAWNLDLTDRQTKGPLCVRTIKVQYSGRPYPIQCMATTARMDYTALGLANGAVVVIKGDFSRERTTKQRVLVEGDGRAVTGLAWSEQSDDNVSDSAAEDTTTPLLYVTTEHSVCGYRLNTGPNSRDLREFHDDLGCPQRCAILTDRHEMALCRPEAVYVYRADGRGPCFVLGGEKRRAWWYRSYLVVAGADPKRVAAASVSATSAASASAATSSTATSSSADGAPSTPPSSALTIYDLKNKCIAFTADFGSPVQHVVAEWGHLYVLTKNRKVYRMII